MRGARAPPRPPPGYATGDIQEIGFLAQFYLSKLFVVGVHTVNLR